MESTGDNFDSHQRELVSIAKAILESRIGLVEASRRICVLRHLLNMEWDKDMLFFVGLDSESDDLPVGAERTNWNADALKQKDEELNRFENLSRPQTIQICQSLLSRFSKEV